MNKKESIIPPPVEEKVPELINMISKINQQLAQLNDNLIDVSQRVYYIDSMNQDFEHEAIHEGSGLIYELHKIGKQLEVYNSFTVKLVTRLKAQLG